VSLGSLGGSGSGRGGGGAGVGAGLSGCGGDVGCGGGLVSRWRSQSSRECLCFAFWGEHWYANEGYTVATLRALNGIRKEGWVVAGVHVLCAAGSD